MNLKDIPTEALLNEFLERAHRGETMLPINHWIGNMAALSLIRDDAYRSTAPEKQWLLNRVVFALTGNDKEYQKWVKDYETTTKTTWSLGSLPDDTLDEEEQGLYDRMKTREWWSFQDLLSALQIDVADLGVLLVCLADKGLVRVQYLFNGEIASRDQFLFLNPTEELEIRYVAIERRP